MKAFSIAISLSIFASYALACTTIHLPANGEKWVLKSYDWHQAHMSAFMNPSGLKKKAFHLKPLSLATWKSKYASLTFNQHGRELPLGGINAAGLAIEIMWLNGSEYPAPVGDQETVNELQWIQYHLDQFSTVQEVVESAKKLAVASIYAKVHFLVCDVFGECAAVEFLKGKPVIHTGANLPFPVLTNDTYSDSASYTKQFTQFGGSLAEVPKGTGSLERFARGAIASQNLTDSYNTITSVFALLKNVGQGDYTKLNVAYDRKYAKVYFRTFVRPSIKSLDLSGDFFTSCAKPAKVLNLNHSIEGDVTTKFEDYTTAYNQKLVEDGLSELAGLLPEGAMKKVAKYPDSFTCEE